MLAEDASESHLILKSGDSPWRDFENRLTSVVLPGTGGTVSFKYDPFGRRIEKTSSTATTIYAYDGDNVVEQLNASGSSTARYTQGLGIDEPLEVYEGNASYYYHADGLGSIVALTKSTGTAVNTYFGYNTFGGMPNPSETVANPFRFTGRDYDSETGLYYYRARYYDSLFGRFLSEDPTGFRGGVNFYSYVMNRPTALTDAMGLQSQYSWFDRYQYWWYEKLHPQAPFLVGPQMYNQCKAGDTTFFTRISPFNPYYKMDKNGNPDPNNQAKVDRWDEIQRGECDKHKTPLLSTQLFCGNNQFGAFRVCSCCGYCKGGNGK